MRWILGIDLNGRSVGALHMAAWLRAHVRAEPAPEFVAVHVLDERLRLVLVPEITNGLAPAIATQMDRVAVQAEVASPLAEVRVQWGHSPEDELAQIATSAAATGLLIGRIAGTDARSLQRLGRVARRLLRRLPVPVLVAPPDLAFAAIGRGPIVLATDLGPSSVRAGRMAAELAAALGRELLITHVDDTLFLATTAAPDGILPLASFPRRAPEEIVEWARANDLPSARVQLVEGERVTRTLDVAQQVDAPLIVCGSRLLGIGERMFASSMASELSRFADRAVLTVPPAT